MHHIKKLRGLQLSNKELGLLLGVEPGTVTTWFNSSRKPLRTVRLLAMVLWRVPRAMAIVSKYVGVRCKKSTVVMKPIDKLNCDDVKVEFDEVE